MTASVALAPTFACPRSTCRAALQPSVTPEGGALVCPACAERYPLMGTLPVLAPQPARHLAVEAIRLRRDLGWFQQQGGLLASAEQRFPRRAAARRRVRSALERTSSCFIEILATLVSHVDRAAVVEVAAQPFRDGDAYGARRICSLLRRDFGGEPEGEAESGSLVCAVREELNACRAPSHRVLVLGCGAGRLAEELASDGAAVTAIDLSAVLLLAALRLRDRPLELCDLQTRNARDAASQARIFTARPRGRRAPSSRAVRYAVADATAMPFADRSWPLIVSVYFTDVVPLSRLLPEIWRVLEPRGRFVHVGPLGYHFDDPAEHLGADELVDSFRDGGFDVGPVRWQPSTFHRCPGSLYAGSFDNLVFSARKAKARSRVDHTAPPFAA